jgi:hypothetical protein
MEVHLGGSWFCNYLYFSDPIIIKVKVKVNAKVRRWGEEG